jgi:hypothetical protein
MSPRLVSFTALAVSMLAGLCWAAGSPSFGIMTRETANFAGLCLGTLAAILWIGAGALRAKRPSSDVRV